MPVTSLTSINININCVDNMSIVFLRYPKALFTRSQKPTHTQRRYLFIS